MNGSLQNLALIPPDWPSVPSTFCHTTACSLFATVTVRQDCILLADFPIGRSEACTQARAGRLETG
jgi:hypothetical protein